MRYMQMKHLRRFVIVAAACSFLLPVSGDGALTIKMGDSLAWSGESNVICHVSHSLDLADWTASGVSATGSGTMVQMPMADIVGTPIPTNAFFRLAMSYPQNENGDVQDMLTPVYYNAAAEDAFRDEVNRFIYCCRKERFHHPLQNGSDPIPAFTAPAWGNFGAPKPVFGEPSQHHPAVDIKVGTGETDVHLFAVHDGVAATYKDADKYRHYLSITKEIVADGQVVGKLVTLYGHIDLDLDEADSLFMDGQHVNKGDLVSRHLYSETMGGPHLHFEIRYYRSGDSGDGDFYGLISPPDRTTPSAGIWLYGFWDPTNGYGFGDPKNHGLFFY